MTDSTVSEDLNASYWTYDRPPQMPADLQPFLVNGQQLTQQITLDGFYAAAFVNPAGEVIIAYEGTDLEGLAQHTAFALAQLAADVSIYYGQNTAAYTDAANFAKQVLADAQQQGISASDVTVTGHSLGGAEAEYVAATLGLSGDTLGGPGIPASDIGNSPAQLTDYIEYGDPVGNYASSPPILGNFIYSDSIAHFGATDYIGSPADAIPLALAGVLYGQSTTATATALGLLAVNAATFHVLEKYAESLGVVIGSPTLTGAAVTSDLFTDHGTNAVLLGNGGTDYYLATTGNDTIATAAGGVGLVAPGSGNDIVVANGTDLIFPGTGGNDTVFAVGRVFAGMGSGQLTFVNGENPATVIGGSGSALIATGDGGGLFAGGAAGNNTIIGGQGAATIYGGGSGDQLFAAGASTQVLVAGGGNETLFGGSATGNDVFYAGAGNTLIAGGAGNDVLFAGTGNATMAGGSGSNLFAFLAGHAGGTDLITDFNAAAGDRVTLQGYAAGVAEQALASATVSGGSTTLALSDSTHIVFSGVTDLTAAAFV